LLGQNPGLVSEAARDGRTIRAKPMPGMGLADGDWGSCVGELNRLALVDNRRPLPRFDRDGAARECEFYPVAPNGLAVFDVGAASERLGMQSSLADNYAHMNDRVQSLITLAGKHGRHCHRQSQRRGAGAEEGH
jgi:hypothetical protein